MLRLSEISGKEPQVRLEPSNKSSSDTTSSRGGASSNGSVNADIIDLSPQVPKLKMFHYPGCENTYLCRAVAIVFY